MSSLGGLPVASTATRRHAREAALSRPFRHDPPERSSGSLIRPAVQRTLAGRFDRRVTLVVGGAGFGKSTALVNAIAENRLLPLGADLWMACEQRDADPEFFRAGLAWALRVDDPKSDDELIETAAERIGGSAPQRICLMLDDVQLLSPESAALADRLIDELPRNASIVLAGRSLPELRLARLELIGQAERIDESDLAFTPEEIRSILGDDAADALSPAVGAAGWPALIELSRRGSGADFVSEEVLDLLEPTELAALETLVALDGADAGVLDAVGVAASPDVLDDLPLVHRRGDRWAPHDLWHDLLTIDESRRAHVHESAIEHLLGRGDPEWALELAWRLGGTVTGVALGERALRDVLVARDVAKPADLHRWAQWAPAVDRRRPATLLLDGLLRRLESPGSDDCVERLDAAAAASADAGDADAEIVALSALVYSFHVRRDSHGLLGAFGRLGELADAGNARARPFPIIGEALLATALGKSSDVITATDQLVDAELSAEMAAVVWWLRAHAQINVGVDATDAATRCHELGVGLPGLAAVYAGARFRAGRFAELLAEPFVMLDSNRDRFLSANWRCVALSVAGDVEGARAALSVVLDAADDDAQWQTVGSLAIPKAVVAVLEGDLDEAAALMREMVDDTPTDGPRRFYYTTAIMLVYGLVPEMRSWYDEFEQSDEFGPQFARDLALARAFVALDEDREVEQLADVPFPDTAGEMLAAIDLPRCAMVLAGAASVGRDVTGLVSELVALLGERTRLSLRRLADGLSPTYTDLAPAVVEGAKALLVSIPVPPSEQVGVRLLGSTELVRGGTAVADADWRRERVRALLTYLVTHRDTTRDAVMAALWPDADATAGRRNLRTALNMLHSVLEPDRLGGDAPFFVRSTGQRLELVGDGHLTVDVHEFERHLDEAIAEEEGGTPSRSIEPYRRAVACYRGDLLPDGYDDWVIFERDRLRARFVTAAVRLAELLAATGSADEAIAVATRALDVEPWSEPAHRALIAAHLERGDRAAARRSLDTCRTVLDDLGGPSEPATLELERRLIAAP